MGEILAKIKRNYKTHRIKKEKSESMSEKELKKIFGNKIQELEKEIKKYETNWKKADKSNDDLKKELTSFESYYKNLKYTFLACQKNIDKTANKINKMIEILDKRSEKLGKAKDTENYQDAFGKIENVLKPNVADQQLKIADIIYNLEKIRTKQKDLINNNPGALITPEFLKNKLKAIKKVENMNSDRLEDKTEKLTELINSINKNDTINFDTSYRIAYLQGKKYYLNNFIKFVENEEKQNNSNNINEDAIKKRAENHFKQELKKFAKKVTIPYFVLGVINCFYASLYKSSKKLYQETQKMRQETDKITDNMLKKGLKISAMLIPGLIGMAASVMGACSGNLILFLSALGFIASQLGYSAQEALDSTNSSMSNIDQKNINKLLGNLEEVLKQYNQH